MKLSELIEGTRLVGLSYRTPQIETRLPDIEIKGIAYDSRKVKEGYIFVVRPAASKYVEEAIKNGAVFLVLEEETEQGLQLRIPYIVVEDASKWLAILAQKFYEAPSKKLKVIGITGTFGKTTSTWLIKSIYETSGVRTGLIGTIEYEIGGQRIPAHHTTPESLELQRIFSELLQSGAEAVVMEVSSHGLALYRVYGIDFDIAGFTRLDRDHIDFHKTIEGYKLAKLKLFTELKSEAIAVLNRDDPTYNEFKERTKAKVVSYGSCSLSCDVCGEISSVSEKGIEVQIKWDGKQGKIISPLLGSYNLHNILLAAACGLKDGIDFEVVRQGIERMSCIPGRFERIGRVIIDYAHTPGALKWALRSAREIVHSRLICIFGCGGDRDRGKRAEMGKIAAELADYVILTTDNPRSEDPQLIVQDIIKGITSDNYEVVFDRREAIRKGIERSSNEDIVLVAGKGHEEYQIYGELLLPWSDREVVKEELGVK